MERIRNKTNWRDNQTILVTQGLNEKGYSRTPRSLKSREQAKYFEIMMLCETIHRVWTPQETRNVKSANRQHVNVNVNVICLPTEHQGVHKNSFRNVRAFQDLIGIFF